MHLTAALSAFALTYANRPNSERIMAVLNIHCWTLEVSVYLTEATVHDVKALDNLYIETGAIYLMDKGYVDFYRLFNLIHKKNAFFVTKAKDNMLFEIVSSTNVDQTTGVIADDRIKLIEARTSS